jgi:hypothetical protein
MAGSKMRAVRPRWVQLKKALEADLAFRAELASLIEEIRAKAVDRIVQTANVSGHYNVTNYIVGSPRGR